MNSYTEDLMLENAWSLNNPDLSQEGYRANALLKFLEEQGHNVLDNEQTEQLVKIKNKINELEDLKSEPNSDKEGIDDEINILESEYKSISEEGYSVYDMIPDGSYYENMTFVVEDLDERYAVGDEYEMYESSKESLLSLIDDYSDIRKVFSVNIENFLDEDNVKETVRNFYSDSFWDSPGDYIDESRRELSNSQEQLLLVLNDKVKDSLNLVKKFENLLLKTNNENVKITIDKLNTLISEYEEEIEDITKNPDGDFSNETIESELDNFMDGISGSEVDHFLDIGYEIDRYYVDIPKLIDHVIESDGYQILSGYDGNVDEVRVKSNHYYVIRVD
jgi:hypothetical protein